ncbi:MAG: ectonucleotide pyrophosphatase/phosphodiesterase [Pyrinomonadaceae bacterium]
MAIPKNVIAQKPVRDLKPTVILISIDGFRPDYLDKYNPKTLMNLANSGVRAKWMTPSFPSKTFPNHYAIATGLYPQDNGLIANEMYDPKYEATFSLADRAAVKDPMWWWGEPIWVTAEKQGQTAASYFFPGTETEIQGIQPTYWKPYDGEVPNETRVDTILSWLDLRVENRPTLLTLYFSDVDDAGHRYSPQSIETKDAVLRVDTAIDRLLNGLKKRKIAKKVNLIVVSDHGMAEIKPENRIALETMFETDDAERVLWANEFVQIFPKEDKEATIYDSIRKELPPQAKVYLKKDIPARFNYRENRRIAPIFVLAEPGWRLLNNSSIKKENQAEKTSRMFGGHGYDNEAVSMRALFIARGPAFKKHYLAEPFQNIEVYNLITAILKLKPANNDGNIENVRYLLR